MYLHKLLLWKSDKSTLMCCDDSLAFIDETYHSVPSTIQFRKHWFKLRQIIPNKEKPGLGKKASELEEFRPLNNGTQSKNILFSKDYNCIDETLYKIY